jgi:hypothetical protein
MKALALSTLLLPLLSTLSLLPSTATAQQGVCLTRSIIYGVPRTWFLYISNYTALSSQPGFDNFVLDPALTVTEEQVNYLDGSASGIPPRGPYATSKKDFIAKVKKGLQFPYREYVGEITYSLEQLEADEYECDALTAGFTATAQTVKTKGRHVDSEDSLCEIW